MKNRWWQHNRFHNIIQKLVTSPNINRLGITTNLKYNKNRGGNRRNVWIKLSKLKRILCRGNGHRNGNGCRMKEDRNWRGNFRNRLGCRGRGRSRRKGITGGLWGSFLISLRGGRLGRGMKRAIARSFWNRLMKKNRGKGEKSNLKRTRNKNRTSWWSLNHCRENVYTNNKYKNDVNSYCNKPNAGK